MMMKSRFLVLSILFVLFAFVSRAGIETFSARKAGSTDLVTSSTVPLLSVYDARYYDMLTNASWSSDYSIKGVKNVVRLGLNPSVVQTNDLSGTATVEIRMWKWVSSAFVMTTTTQTLSLSYVHATATTVADEINSYSFSDAHRVEVYLTGTTGASFDLNDIFISSEMEVERYYALPSGAITGLSVDASDAHYYEFNWDQKVGAEYYELEWVHISDATLTSNPSTGGGTYVATSALNYDYYLNSTRVTVSGNTYRIPRIFNKGYIVYRIRPIGLIGSAFDYRNEGDWTNGENGTVSAHTAGNVITVSGDYDVKMNWSHQVSYDDKGGRFEGISYADGLGRGRQQIGHNTVTKQSVVSNVYYDELGRSVIADLPTPVNGEDHHFTASFNAFQTDNSPSGISPNDFDAGSTTACNTIAAPFSTAGGAGRYYSTSNTTQDGANTRIPDAEQYPYSRAYYMNDFTGRLEKTAGAGGTLRGGNGHDSWFYYPSPNQSELDALFGAEVGQASHYEKMVTVDANGQVYTQYSDMAGRVIASYLSGDSPSALSPIEGNGSVSATVGLLPQNEQHVDLSVPSSTLTYSEYFPADADYTFSYSFTPAQFQNACMGEGFCMDCVYDMKLTIIEECSGIVKHETLLSVVGEDLNNVCAADSPESFTTSAIHLTKGGYQIIKTLSLHTSILSENWCTYINQSTCLTPVSELFTDLYEAEPFEGCIDEVVEEEMDDCALHKAQMLADLMPGGQYARYVNTNGVYTALANVSTTHSVLTEDNLATDKDWKHPVTPYINNDGSTPVPDPATYTTVHDFIANFQSKWAESLLPYHPEYCFLKFCDDSLSTSNGYDQDMLATYDYSTACAAGYFKPFSGCDPSPIPCTTSGNDPYFSAHTVHITPMLAAMDDYHGSGYSIWEHAVFNAYCFGNGTIATCLSNFAGLSTDDKDCYMDLIWVNYRSLYLELKQQITYAQQTSVCSNSQIGLGDWSTQYPIWGNAALLPNMETDMVTGISALEAQTYLDAISADACQSACEQYATDWISQLSGCEQYTALTTLQKDNMYADLVDLCISGCDSDHPAGSTTAPSGYSGPYSTIDAVLLAYFGSGYEDALCTSLLISEPGPYTSNDDMQELSVQPLDTCGCRAIEEANYDLTTNNPLGYNLEQMLAHNTGITLEDANYLLCTCNKFLDNAYHTYDPEDPNPWITGATEALASLGMNIPATLSCSEGGGCVNCETIYGLYDDLVGIRFEEVDGFTTSYTFPTILTNFLNNELGFHLTYDDYVSYMSKCGASSGTPYCELNPLMNEWASMMTLISFRGEIITSSSTPIDLASDNIVFANGAIQDAITGHEYWSSLSGNTLTTTLGNSTTNCNITLTLPGGAAFGFEDIVKFENVQATSTSCSENTAFTVNVTYLSCGQLHVAELTGTSSCFKPNICYCAPTTELLCDELPSAEEGLCYQPRLNELYQNALELYLENVAVAYTAYEAEYKSDCAAAFSTETLSYTGPRNNYHYTLFFYDQAGNLVRTVAPLGPEAGFTSVNIDAARNSVVDFSTYTALSAYVADPAFPVNTYETKYQYNSYNQLVSTTNPDQSGTNPNTLYWYDRYGRIVASQNPVQSADKKYSYILYDEMGRPIESGQIDRDVPPAPPLSGYTLSAISETTIKQDDKGAGFKNWVYNGVRTEVTFTVYDDKMSSTVAAKFKSSQQNLRLRVASVVYFDAVGFVSTMPTTGYASANHYSYDVHGNVIEMLQDVPALAPVHQDIKSTRYEFELLSGNVNKVKYQEEEYNTSNSTWEAGRDRITHEYLYDALNRLTQVFTSTDGGVHKSREAHYRYFDYGPLARVELGEYKVQANDYSYTINGWMKGMNSNTLKTTRDPGRDGAGGTVGYYASNVMAHDAVAQDVNGYTLGYFEGDYKSITATTAFEADPYYGTSNALEVAQKSLYNGNIAHVVSAISDLPIQASIYKYDQLQRLKSMDVFRSTGLISNNNWAAAASTNEYKSTYSYDRNGNLLTLFRNGTTSPALGMDDFTYHYQAGTNRLTYVSDVAGTDGNYTEDINSGQGTTNYTYDDLGQLTGDAQAGIGTNGLVWRKGDKKLLSQKGASTYLEFIYNPLGQRVVKIEKNVSSGNIVAQSAGYSWKYTYYAYDANGQVMATYDVTMNSSASSQKAILSEQIIYGAGRLGVVQQDKEIYNNAYSTLEGPKYTNKWGKKNYELTNYLGNVNVVVTDRKIVTQNTQLSDINTFDSGLTGWSASSGTPTVSGGQLAMTQTGSTIYVRESYTTIVGEDYTVSLTVTQGTSSGLSAVINGVTYALTSGVTNQFKFTASSTSTEVRVKPTSGSGTYTYYVQDARIQARAKYTAVVIMKADYYPFGMAMPGRNSNVANYRYGYNGMEIDPEMKGNGNAYTTEFRQYDPRLGRWMSLDPLMVKFPDMSPYCAFNNNPVFFVDPLGLEGTNKDGKGNSAGGLGDPPKTLMLINSLGGAEAVSEALENLLTTALPEVTIQQTPEQAAAAKVRMAEKRRKFYNIPYFMPPAPVADGMSSDLANHRLPSRSVPSMQPTPYDAITDPDEADRFINRRAFSSAIGEGRVFDAAGIALDGGAQGASDFFQACGVEEQFADEMGEGFVLGASILLTEGMAAPGATSIEISTTTAVATAAETEMAVYVSVENGVTQYAGITNDLARRAAEHLSEKGISIQPLMEGLTYSDARAVEQALIEIHGLGKYGGTLLNKINSISAKNPVYGEQLSRGYELLKSIGYE